MSNSADLASCESADIQRRILELIEGASSIAISGHTSPDGDALGSVLGLGLSLMKVFPDKDIALLLADDDPVPRIYRFMEGADLRNPVWCRHLRIPAIRTCSSLWTCRSSSASIIPPRCFAVRPTWRALTIIRRARSLPRSALGASMPLLVP